MPGEEGGLSGVPGGKRPVCGRGALRSRGAHELAVGALRTLKPWQEALFLRRDTEARRPGIPLWSQGRWLSSGGSSLDAAVLLSWAPWAGLGRSGRAKRPLSSGVPCPPGGVSQHQDVLERCPGVTGGN